MNKKLTRSEIRSFIKTILTESTPQEGPLFDIDKLGTTQLPQQAVITHMMEPFYNKQTKDHPDYDPQFPEHMTKGIGTSFLQKLNFIIDNFLEPDSPFRNDMQNIVNTAVRLNKEKIGK